MEEALRTIMTLVPSIADTLSHVLAVVGPYGMNLILIIASSCAIFSFKGSRKRSLISRMVTEFPGSFKQALVHTDKNDRTDSHTSLPFWMIRDTDTLSNEIEAGDFAIHQEIRGFLYGYRLSDIRQIQSSGKVCVIALEHEEDLTQLIEKTIAFSAIYVQSGLPTTADLHSPDRNLNDKVHCIESDISL